MKDRAPDGINGDTTPHNKARRMAPMGVYELMVALVTVYHRCNFSNQNMLKDTHSMPHIKLPIPLNLNIIVHLLQSCNGCYGNNVSVATVVLCKTNPG